MNQIEMLAFGYISSKKQFFSKIQQKFILESLQEFNNNQFTIYWHVIKNLGIKYLKVQ